MELRGREVEDVISASFECACYHASGILETKNRRRKKTVKTNFFFGDGWIGSFGKVYGDFFYHLARLKMELLIAASM